MHQEIAYFDKVKTGDLITRLASDTTLMGTSLAGNSAAALLRSTTQIIGSFSLMLYLSPQLFCVMAGVLPIAFVGTRVYGKFVKETQVEVQNRLSDATAVAEERLTNIRTVRAFGMEQRQEKTYGNMLDSVFEIQMKQVKGSSIFFGSGQAVMNLFMLAVIGYGGSLVQAGMITAGTLTSFLMYSIYVSMSSFGLGQTYGEIMKGVGAGSRVFSIIDRISEIPTSGGVSLDKLNGTIEF
eukprot:UN31014